MDDFEYAVRPPGRDDERRWVWEGAPVAFDGSAGGETLDWSETAAVRPRPRTSRHIAELLGIDLDDPDVDIVDDDMK